MSHEYTYSLYLCCSSLFPGLITILLPLLLLLLLFILLPLLFLPLLLLLFSSSSSSVLPTFFSFCYSHSFLLAHIMEEERDAEDGVQFLTSTRDDWSHSMYNTHLTWHLALHYFGTLTPHCPPCIHLFSCPYTHLDTHTHTQCGFIIKNIIKKSMAPLHVPLSKQFTSMLNYNSKTM